jgi:hypothetical protein
LVFLYNNYIEMHGQENIELRAALPTHCLTETTSKGTVNLLLKTPQKLLPRFQLAICIHLDTVSDTPLGAALSLLTVSHSQGTGRDKHVEAYKG